MAGTNLAPLIEVLTRAGVRLTPWETRDEVLRAQREGEWLLYLRASAPQPLGEHARYWFSVHLPTVADMRRVASPPLFVGLACGDAARTVVMSWATLWEKVEREVQGRNWVTESDPYVNLTIKEVPPDLIVTAPPLDWVVTPYIGQWPWLFPPDVQRTEVARWSALVQAESVLAGEGPF